MNVSQHNQLNLKNLLLKYVLLLTPDDTNVDKGNTTQAYLTADDKYHKVFHEIQLWFLVDFLYDFSV